MDKNDQIDRLIKALQDPAFDYRNPHEMFDEMIRRRELEVIREAVIFLLEQQRSQPRT